MEPQQYMDLVKERLTQYDFLFSDPDIVSKDITWLTSPGWRRRSSPGELLMTRSQHRDESSKFLLGKGEYFEDSFLVIGFEQEIEVARLEALEGDPLLNPLLDKPIYGVVEFERVLGSSKDGYEHPLFYVRHNLETEIAVEAQWISDSSWGNSGREARRFAEELEGLSLEESLDRLSRAHIGTIDW